MHEPESDAESLFRKGLTEYRNQKYAAAVERFRKAAETGYADGAFEKTSLQDLISR